MPEAAKDDDAFNQETQSSGPDIPLQFIVRSGTILSLEERDLQASPRSPLENAPHRQDFYQAKWFWGLVVLIYLQALLISGLILSGAYGYSEFYTQEPVELLKTFSSYALVWVPSLTMAYTHMQFHVIPWKYIHLQWLSRLRTSAAIVLPLSLVIALLIATGSLRNLSGLLFSISVGVAVVVYPGFFICNWCLGRLGLWVMARRNRSEG